ncbi:MAG: DUF1015 domain-containing protein [Candidatus Omnitrophica bacterium]|nr:DUF1015 domain-containing protein [Candidatus Omnitrophota bacterium]
MAQIKPFRGVLYNPRLIDDLSKAVTPPYDVISENMQEEYYSLHRNNVIRLILGRIKKGDNRFSNRYTRAKKFFKSWIDKGILLQDKTPSLYIYRQDYYFRGNLKTRLGFVSLMKVEDPHKSRVLPHEYTFAKPKKDRLNLLKATRANLSPIFTLYDDRDSLITEILKVNTNRDPDIDIEQDGVSHKLWRLSDQDVISKISDLVKDKQVFIADGHHRYEVALTFRDMMRKRKRRSQREIGSDYIMVYFSNLDPESQTILSTHRVIRSIKKTKFQKPISELKRYFHVENLKSKDEMFSKMEGAGEDESVFGMYYKKEGFLLLTLKERDVLSKIIAQNRSYQWKWLDVTILHQLIFNHILKVKEKVAKKDNIVYTRETDYAVRLVDEGGYQVCFFLNPPKIEQVRDVASSRDRMPRKTTYFYPKPLSGLVFYKHEA